MSAAFKQQWLRTSASKRLLIMLTALAKANGEVAFSLDDLENVHVEEGIRQRFDGNRLVVSYRDPHKVADEAEQTFVIQEGKAVERLSNEWQNETDIPSRLQDLIAPPTPSHQSPTVTTNDAEMAAREQQYNSQTRVQRAAAQRRGVPLPVPQPPHPVVS